jgi:transposase
VPRLPFDAVIARLVTIPGIGLRIVHVVAAETGGDMARLASSSPPGGLGRLTPDDNDSAGKRRKAA